MKDGRAEERTQTMDTRLSYADALEAIGLYVERAGGADVFVNELDDGYLVSFLVDDAQHVASLGTAELVRLHGEARRRGLGGLFRRRDGRNVRARLRVIGRYLDAQRVMAASIVAQERASGYSVEYTGLADVRDDLSGLTRRHEELDDARVRALAT